MVKRMKITEPPCGEVVQCNLHSSGPIDEAYHMAVSLSTPSEDEECPITMEKMINYDLEFLPNITYYKNAKTHRKMTLKCGHSFSAMALIYHFAKTNLKCPLCRDGTNEKLNKLCIPLHFRGVLLDRIASQAAKEAEDAEAANLDAIRALIAEDEGGPRTALIFRVRLEYSFVVSLYTYERESDVRPLAPIEYPMVISFEETGSPTSRFLRASMSQESLDNMRRLYMGSLGPYMSLVISQGGSGRNPLLIDRSPRFDVLSQATIDSALMLGARFEVSMDNQTGALTKVDWVVPSDFIQQWAIDTAMLNHAMWIS